MSQVRFVMHPEDECAFVASLLSDQSVNLIDGPRWKNSVPETFRSIERISGTYCIIWSPDDRATLKARYIPNCNDWYCESEGDTIQFLRSESNQHVLTEGRIAISGQFNQGNDSPGVEARFKKLARFVKKQYKNSIIHWAHQTLPPVRPSKADRSLWVGPHALKWLTGHRDRLVKQSIDSPVEGRIPETIAHT